MSYLYFSFHGVVGLYGDTIRLWCAQSILCSLSHINRFTLAPNTPPLPLAKSVSYVRQNPLILVSLRRITFA